MNFKVECPHCGQRISAAPSDCGSESSCPNCGNSFTVPAAPSALSSTSEAPDPRSQDEIKKQEGNGGTSPTNAHLPFSCKKFCWFPLSRNERVLLLVVAAIALCLPHHRIYRLLLVLSLFTAIRYLLFFITTPKEARSPFIWWSHPGIITASTTLALVTVFSPKTEADPRIERALQAGRDALESFKKSQQSHKESERIHNEKLQAEQAASKVKQEQTRLADSKRRENEAAHRAEVEKSKQEQKMQYEAKRASRKEQSAKLEQERKLAQENKRLADEADNKQKLQAIDAARHFDPPCFALFKWDDSLFELVSKAKAIRTVTTISINSNPSPTRFNGWSADVTNVKTIAEISSTVSAAIKTYEKTDNLNKALSIVAADLRGIPNGSIVGAVQLKNMTSFDRAETQFGKDTLLYSTPKLDKQFYLSVSPIIINKCPFTLLVTLVARPEMAFLKGDGCIYFPETRCVMPLVIRELQLKSDSSMLYVAKEQIFLRAKEKYNNANFLEHHFPKDEDLSSNSVGRLEGHAKTFSDGKKRFDFEISSWLPAGFTSQPYLTLEYKSDVFLDTVTAGFLARQVKWEREKNGGNASEKGL